MRIFFWKLVKNLRIFFAHYEKIRVMITQSTKSLARFLEWSFLDTQTSLKRVHILIGVKRDLYGIEN